jgi:hypothetical protein
MFSSRSEYLGARQGKVLYIITSEEPDTDSVTLINKNVDSVASLRIFNLLAYAALKSDSADFARDLCGHYRLDVSCFLASMRRSYTIIQQPGAIASASLGELVSQGFANIRLWLLIIRLASRSSDNSSEYVGASDAKYWEGVWPACERLLTLSESDGELSV